ncbi:ATP-binding protein [Hymenobacter sp. BT770]|uniref:ATP-binding protein n=1 Tax=Hymenobacter sp. BT770 TaxID=2886942 RepID=UPI001D128380|nr:ATP-binding protein [Hymenobacter sp. BT770]MCC3154589.1 histidine kinase [Hymenobacter sp. BT770]MDO3416643.1 ATP-binding protein [Hymenobacter sp. BT770]
MPILTLGLLKRVGGLLCLLTLLLLSPGPLRAQTALHRYWAASPDSLRRVLAAQRADTTRLRTMLHLVDCSLYSVSVMPDMAAVVALAKRLRRPEYRAYRLLLAGVQGKGAAALDSLQAAVTAFDQMHRPAALPLSYLREVFSSLNREEARLAYYQTKRVQYLRSGDTISLAVCHHALGGSYTYRGDYNQATSQYLHAAELGRSASPYLYHNFLLSVAGGYRRWGNDAKALHYMRLAEPGLTSIVTRAGLFQARGFIYLRQQDYPDALRAADQVLISTASVGPGPAPAAILRARAYALVLKSQVLLALGRVREAGLLLQPAQALADSLRLPLVTMASANELDATWARYYGARGEPARAEAYWLRAYRKARAAHSTPLRLAYLRALTLFYQQQGQPAPAARYAVAALALADSLEAREGTLHVASYEIEQSDRAQTVRIAGLRQAQQQAAARARRQRWVLGAVLAALALIGGFSFLLWRSNRLKQRANALLSQQKAEIQAQKGELEAQRDQLDNSLTELRTTQAQLIQKEKMASLGELTAGIAHEIQNPLNFVNNFSEVSAELVAELREERAKGVKADAGLEEELLEDLTQNLVKITQHGQRAAGIVKGMLEHSSPSAGEREATDLNRLCDEYLRLAYQGLRAKDKSFNAALSTDFLADLPTVNVVGADVGRVLLNLFTNAFYAVRQRQLSGEPGYQPQVGVRTILLNQQVQIQVSDNGTGMSPAVQQKIFQPFFTTKPTGEGTGLGLSLSHDIIAQGHGGSLGVESQEGEGTTFSVGLPLNRPA